MSEELVTMSGRYVPIFKRANDGSTSGALVYGFLAAMKLRLAGPGSPRVRVTKSRKVSIIGREGTAPTWR
jgi:hypothetical protein